MRTKADKGEGGSILADILRTSFMDDPYSSCHQIELFSIAEITIFNVTVISTMLKDNKFLY